MAGIGGCGKGWVGGTQVTFKAVKQLFMILSWWDHDIMYLFKSVEYKIPKVYPNVNYELWVTMKVHELQQKYHSGGGC